MPEKAQNLIEFIIIIILIAIGAILALTVLGGNVHSLFSTSNTEVKKYKPFDWENSSNSTPRVVSVSTVTNTEVTYYSDGSATFNVEGQQIHLKKDIIDNMNIVFNTVGAEGVSDWVVSAIQEIIEKNKSKYEPDDVPLQMYFGTGKRQSETPNYESIAKGEAQLNTIGISVGNDFVIIQKDQTCTGQQCSLTEGTYKINGTINSSNNTIDSTSVTGELVGGTSQQGTFTNATFTDDVTNDKLIFSGTYTESYHNYDSSWEIDFSKSTDNFKI